MEILLDKVSKRFNQDWLFKDLSYRFELPGSYAIVGANGSGKTTLLKIISGMIPPTGGSIKYNHNKHAVDPDAFYQHISYVAPYLELPEELSLNEFLKFHFNLKIKNKKSSINEIAVRSGLIKAIKKPLHTFSSGMKQRLKLAIALYCATPVLMLDEPTTNLDQSGIDWYLEEMNRVKFEKLILVSSNQSNEYGFCDQTIELGG